MILNRLYPPAAITIEMSLISSLHPAPYGTRVCTHHGDSFLVTESPRQIREAAQVDFYMKGVFRVNPSNPL